MQEKDYWRLLNVNTLICHSVIIMVLIVAYIGEVIKGNRTVGFVLLFSVICLLPLLLEYVMYKRDNASKRMKTLFVVGYASFYTFNVITAASVMNWVYILPMASVLLCYCDLELILGLFGYSLILNLTTLVLQYKQVLPVLSMTTPEEKLTSWEIQIACIFLTGIFLYMSTKLIKERNNVISHLMDDVYEDELTECKNVRFFNEMQDDTFKFSSCDKLCIGFIDIDDFKHFNTEYGHKFGDMVLKEIGTILINITADVHNTYAIRVGGDEFIIISSSLNDKSFESLCDMICKKISHTIVEYGESSASVNISMGLSSKSHDRGCRTINELYILADNRNQKAKNKGKNCLIF